MSFSFYLHAPAPPTFSAFVEELAEDALRVDDAPPGDVFAEGYFCHPYIAGRSARGIELGLEGGKMQVRTMTCSSRADYALGVRAMDTLARMLGAKVEPEDGEAMARESALKAYDDAWIDWMVRAGPETALAIAAKSPLTMIGPKRPFHLGPRFAAELRARAADKSIGEHLIDAMVKLQAVDEDRYYADSILRVSPKGGSIKSFTVATWGPDVAYLFPESDCLAIAGTGGPIYVPRAAGPEIAGPRWTFLDEKTALVEATPAADWDALQARARSFEANFLAVATGVGVAPSKPWWKFW